MDNRIFNVNGKTSEQLLATLELVFSQSGTKLCTGWVYDQNLGLILTWYNTARTTPFMSSKGLNVRAVFAQVESWLESDEAKLVLNNCGGWDEDTEHDGSNSIGWRVYCEDWGHVGGLSNAICAIKPVYLWHGK